METEEEYLRHSHPGESRDSFFKRIDRFGGWPLDKKYVGFEHTENRKAGFTDTYTNSGWWTTIASADDYYRWKLSAEAIATIKNEARREIANEISGRMFK